MKFWTILSMMLLATSISAQTDGNSKMGTTETQNPRAEEDGSWIAISGEVTSVSPGKFTLNYGDGTIPVHLEMENAEDTEHEFIDGEKVRVYGLVDEGFLKGTAILARAVFIESMSSYVYSTDGVQEFIRISTPGIASGTVVQGTVTSVTDGNLTLDEGDRKLMVDTSTITEDTDGATGLENVKEGDRVAVVGNMGREFFTARTLRATSIMPLEGSGGELQGSDREY